MSHAREETRWLVVLLHTPSKIPPWSTGNKSCRLSGHKTDNNTIMQATCHLCPSIIKWHELRITHHNTNSNKNNNNVYLVKQDWGIVIPRKNIRPQISSLVYYFMNCVVNSCLKWIHLWSILNKLWSCKLFKCHGPINAPHFKYIKTFFTFP